jgi:hemerythrin superfamily protein
MDVLHFIKSYHDEVKQVLDSVESADGLKERRQRLDDLARLVQAYLDLEKDYLYPEIGDLFAGVDTLVRAGEANGAAIGRRVKSLVKLLAKPVNEQEGWEKRLAELRASLIEHFDSEEQVLMPKMRLMIRTEDREDLGQVFLDARDELLRGDEEGVTIGAGSRKRA